jgi:hypothetical protein
MVFVFVDARRESLEGDCRMTDCAGSGSFEGSFEGRGM